MLLQKEAGLILAARFCLYSNNIKEAFRISQKVLATKQANSPSTAFEMEATTIVQWCTIAEIEMLGGIDQSSRQQLQAINDMYSNNRNNEQFDPDTFMLWAKSRHLFGRNVDVLNILNQVRLLLFVTQLFTLVSALTHVYLILILLGHRDVPVVPACAGGQDVVAGHRGGVGTGAGHSPEAAGRGDRQHRRTEGEHL